MSRTGWNQPQQCGPATSASDLTASFNIRISSFMLAKTIPPPTWTKAVQPTFLHFAFCGADHRLLPSSFVVGDSPPSTLKILGSDQALRPLICTASPCSGARLCPAPRGTSRSGRPANRHLQSRRTIHHSAFQILHCFLPLCPTRLDKGCPTPLFFHSVFCGADHRLF